jgi:hypothetical protein
MFFLRKDWRDPEDGIETVILHWTTTVVGQEPGWRRANQVVMVPQPATAPVRRHCSVWITPPFPRKRLLTREPEEQPAKFLFHSFFTVIQRGRMWSTEVENQEIRGRMVSHSDPSVEYTQAFLYYSLDELAHVNCVPMFLEGLPAKFQFLPPLPGGTVSAEDHKMRARRSKLIARLSAPHTFCGQLWGPAGTRALYTVYFSRQGALNPFSEGGFWLLNGGRLWEVNL